MNTKEWEEEFARVGAFWRHDGNPHRPYARLTSGLISNGFFNGTRVAEDGHLFGLACQALWRMADAAQVPGGTNLRIVGAEKGGIALATRIAESARSLSAFAEKTEREGLLFKRFDLSKDQRFLMVEDTITTGGTLLSLERAVTRQRPTADFHRVVLALCNRSGKPTYRRFNILSLIAPDFQTWEEGANPFTGDGTESVPPVRPKEGWEQLTRQYH